MPALNAQTNPFILMMDPQAVFAQIEASERLARLHSRVCRPLDKPQIDASDAVETDAAELAGDQAAGDDAVLAD